MRVLLSNCKAVWRVIGARAEASSILPSSFAEEVRFLMGNCCNAYSREDRSRQWCLLTVYTIDTIFPGHTLFIPRYPKTTAEIQQSYQARF